MDVCWLNMWTQHVCWLYLDYAWYSTLISHYFYYCFLFLLLYAPLLPRFIRPFFPANGGNPPPRSGWLPAEQETLPRCAWDVLLPGQLRRLEGTVLVDLTLYINYHEIMAEIRGIPQNRLFRSYTIKWWVGSGGDHFRFGPESSGWR